MAILKVIEWTDNSTNTLVYKFPMEGKEIMFGSALTVRESQVAIFVNKGVIADIFEPGFYKLSTSNLPFLTKLMSWKYGFNSPFKAEIYYVNTRQFADQKWGTINPIMLRDADFGVVRIRGFGKFSFKVSKPDVFLKELFGTSSSFKTQDIIEYLRSMIIQCITDTIAEKKVSALDLASNYREISKAVTKDCDADFSEIGLKIANVIIENISLPEEVEKMLDKRTSMGVLGDQMGTYMQFQTAEAMRDAAKNPGSGGLAGMGVGLGAGVGMGRAFGQNLNSGLNSDNSNTGGGAGKFAGKTESVKTEKCLKCGHEMKAGAKFCPDCGAKTAFVKCGKCGCEMREGAKFCPECGTSMSAPVNNKCVKCGHDLKKGAKFCPDCGEKQE